MTSTNDLDLLRKFTRDQSQDAFTAVVQRHLNLVYCAALRQVRSPQLAEEVAQSVFTDLARHAARLRPDTILTAWLYQVTRRTAIDVVRREARRQFREQIAQQMNIMNATDDHWTEIEPFLDEAMHTLDDIDRTAVLLRYFENKSLSEVGHTLGTTDDTARKRINRAIEHLREFFVKHGVTFDASGLVIAISANAVRVATVPLAATIAAAAVSGGTAITSTVTAAVAMTTLQKGLIIAILVASVPTCLLLQHQAQARAHETNQSLQQQADQLSRLKAENERLSNLAAQTGSPNEIVELRRLHSEAELLRGKIKDLGVLREENRRLQHPQEAQTILQMNELVWAKQERTEAWMRAFLAYAGEHQGQLPASFEQAEPFWPKEISKGTGSAADQFEILYHGSLDSLTNRDVIVFREKQSWPHITGKWGRLYGMANGRAQYCSSSDKTAKGNFDRFEREAAALPSGQ